MHLQPAAVWPTKIILRLLLQTYLPRQTSYLQLLFSFSKTSMATANKMIWQALQKRCSRRGRSRNGIFCECRFFNSPKTLREHMYGGFDTCDMRKFILLLRTKKSCKLQNLPSRTSTLFLSLRIGALFLFWTATKSATFLKNFQVTYILHIILKESTLLRGNLYIYKCFVDVL